MPRQTFPVLEESIHCIGRDTRRHVWISTRVQSLNTFVHPKSFLTNNNFPQLRNKKKFQLLHVLKTWKTKLNAITQHFVVSFSVTTSLRWSFNWKFQKRHSLTILPMIESRGGRGRRGKLWNIYTISLPRVPSKSSRKWLVVVVVVSFIPPRHFFPIHRCQNYLRDKNCLRSLSPRYTRRLIREKKRRENRIERKTQLQRATGG